MAKAGAKEKYCRLFLEGLNDKMKKVLAHKTAPTHRSLASVGWDERSFLFGTYAKVLRPLDGESDPVAALYMGSSTGIYNGDAASFGLKGRRRSHETAKPSE